MSDNVNLLSSTSELDTTQPSSYLVVATSRVFCNTPALIIACRSMSWVDGIMYKDEIVDNHCCQNVNILSLSL